VSQPAEVIDELRLIEAIGAGSERAFEILYLRYQHALIAFADRFIRRRSVAEEIVQSVFADLWRHGQALALHESVRSYLFGAVRLKAYQQFNESQRELAWEDARRRARLGLLSSGDRSVDGTVNAIPEPIAVNAGESKVVIDELVRLIPRVIAEMREPMQTVYLLARKHRMSYDEIAEVMGMTFNMVRKRMLQAHDHLDRRFAELGWPGILRNRGPLSAGGSLRREHD
jgi:RNA polymerase sigma-19 factor, ECF subfamily